MLRVDVTGSLAKSITPTYGITDQEYLALHTPMQRNVEQFLHERQQGQHAWALDPYDRDMASRCREIAKRMKQEKIQTVVWIGIGGSGLGPKVLQEVFEGPNTVEFLVVDTIDPTQLQLYLSILDWTRTLVVVVSKSGSTLETMSAFFLCWEKLKDVNRRKAASRVIAITDPEAGLLRAFADQTGIETLPIPPGVGGRYCIFSPVGLLALSLLDGDLDAFLRGAIDMDTQCQATVLEQNPAALLAATQFLLDTKKDAIIRVIMPYVHRLQSLGRWNQQLVAESLGKTETHNPIPLAAIGTQDQHSLLQQWMDGPRKSWHLFLREREKPELHVPSPLPEPFTFVGGKTFGELLDACHAGTAGALTAVKRPHATIEIARADSYHLGQLFFLFMVEVVLLGKLYRIDPYGQPGVELGKQIAKKILEEG
jgi:glucose-6-phosphate isomerase